MVKRLLLTKNALLNIIVRIDILDYAHRLDLELCVPQQLGPKPLSLLDFSPSQRPKVHNVFSSFRSIPRKFQVQIQTQV